MRSILRSIRITDDAARRRPIILTLFMCMEPYGQSRGFLLKGIKKNQTGGKEQMNRKIIIESDDFDKEIFSFLNEVGADTPVNWNVEALGRIKNAVIRAFEEMGVALEIDDRVQSISSLLTEQEHEAEVRRRPDFR